MSIDFNKPLAKMTKPEKAYHRLEASNIAQSIVRQHGSKGPELLLAISIALRDEAGKLLYGSTGKRDTEKEQSE